MTTELILKQAEVGPWPMNSYALICPHTRQSVLIDPGAEPETLHQMLADSQPIAIWLTHTHPDHVGALNEMRQQLNVPVYAHPGLHVVEPQAEHWLEHGDTVTVGKFTCQLYHTPGHIGDHLCFALPDGKRTIVGDTIFEGGPGRTWSAAGFQQTLQTLREVVLAWGDEVRCYPGHGPHFLLGDKRAEIEAFITRTHPVDFYGDATWEA